MEKAIGSGVASGFPVLIGALAGHTDYGLTASIGGFVYLYAGGESYKKRALKLLLVSIGIALSFGLGTLLSGTVWMMAAVLGLIGAAVMFIFSALGIQGPAPMFLFFLLVSSGLPADPSQALFRAGLTFLGGIFAMGIALIGWLWSKHGPEEAVLQKHIISWQHVFRPSGRQAFITRSIRRCSCSEQLVKRFSARGTGRKIAA